MKTLSVTFSTVQPRLSDAWLRAFETVNGTDDVTEAEAKAKLEARDTVKKEQLQLFNRALHNRTIRLYGEPIVPPPRLHTWRCRILTGKLSMQRWVETISPASSSRSRTARGRSVSTDGRGLSSIADLSRIPEPPLYAYALDTTEVSWWDDTSDDDAVEEVWASDGSDSLVQSRANYEEWLEREVLSRAGPEEMGLVGGVTPPSMFLVRDGGEVCEVARSPSCMKMLVLDASVEPGDDSAASAEAASPLKGRPLTPFVP